MPYHNAQNFYHQQKYKSNKKINIFNLVINNLLILKLILISDFALVIFSKSAIIDFMKKFSKYLIIICALLLAVCIFVGCNVSAISDVINNGKTDLDPNQGTIVEQPYDDEGIFDDRPGQEEDERDNRQEPEPQPEPQPDPTPDPEPEPKPEPTPDPEPYFEDYGLNVITISLSKVKVTENGIYNTMEEVGAYLYLYHKLPSNYVTKSQFKKSNYTSQNKLSVGGDYFGNYEGLLPKGKPYTECDINYRGGNRNSQRIVFSSKDWTIFYTSDHYDSFSILRFVK